RLAIAPTLPRTMCVIFLQAEDGIRDRNVTGVQTCALTIYISIKLNIPYGTLRRWVGNYRKKEQEAVKEGQRQLLTATEYKALYEKERKEKLDLEEENEILKKAMHIFTQEEK